MSIHFGSSRLRISRLDLNTTLFQHFSQVLIVQFGWGVHDIARLDGTSKVNKQNGLL